MRRSHDAFLSAGADLLQTFSWGLYWGLETKADRQSIMVNAARRAAEAVAATMNWQARRVLIAVALIEGGVDLLVAALAAGMDDMCALLAGIAAANSTALPVLAAYEYGVLGLMSGEDLGNALKSGREIGSYSTGVCDEENGCMVGSLTPAEYGEAVAAQALGWAFATWAEDGPGRHPRTPLPPHLASIL